MKNNATGFERIWEISREKSVLYNKIKLANYNTLATPHYNQLLILNKELTEILISLQS